MQAAGDRVPAAAELAAGVQHGEHDLDRRLALGLVDVDRDAAAVVDDAHAAVGQDRDVDVVAVAGERLVDGVVDDLVDEVVEAARTGRSDVHARPLANRFEALENLDVISAVCAAFCWAFVGSAVMCEVGAPDRRILGVHTVRDSSVYQRRVARGPEAPI